MAIVDRRRVGLAGVDCGGDSNRRSHEFRCWSCHRSRCGRHVPQNGELGTHRVGVSVPPQTFDLTLPASVSLGVPASGAGSLETSASEDVYRFSVASAGALQLDLSTCASSLGGGEDWRLMNAAGAVEASGSGCSSVPIAGVAAGSYTLSVTRPGKTGSYRFKLLSAPPADAFDVTLPASSLRDDLETTASEDVYRFTTVAAAPLQVNVSTCATTLGSVSWTLRDAADTVAASNASPCGAGAVANLVAGAYRLRSRATARSAPTRSH